jgi:acyl-CoA thioester hydrolase
MVSLLEKFPVVIELPVAWGEMDAFQHVNSTVFFRYIESGRVAYFEKLGLLEFMRVEQVGPILASTSCRFRKPVTYPDTLWIGTRVSTISDDRFTMSTVLVSRKSGGIAAVARSSIIMYHYAHNSKAKIPNQIRWRILELERL